ncbi:hypothetical protein [Arthrobacter pigmenti]
MTTPNVNANQSPISYESGGSDPDFHFPAAGVPTRGSYRERISSLPNLLLRIIRR